MSIRPIKRIVQSKPTIEGAGVKLRRAFGTSKRARFPKLSTTTVRYRTNYPSKARKHCTQRHTEIAGE